MATATLTPAGVGIRNVLIATDFSRCSTAALHLGLQLAHAYHATADIVFVLPNDPYLLAGPEAYVTARDAARRDLEELKRELQRDHPELAPKGCHLFLLDGDVPDAILNFARQKEIDLIVLGTHGRGGLRKALMGSVAERVFRHSPVPVLTIGPAACCSRPGEPQQILVAADFTAASRCAVRYAATLAREHHAQLTLLHVLDPGHLQHLPDRAAIERGMKTRLAELLEGENEGIPCSIRIAVGRVSRSILEAAKEEQADLLVMGVHSSSGVFDRLTLPHAYEIVREAPCPVLTLRESTFIANPDRPELSTLKASEDE
ncbi:MAG TPA: universal stress protein [Bryocella sp.]|nr:universal stress protein [Bryocella sp.]